MVNSGYFTKHLRQNGKPRSTLTATLAIAATLVARDCTRIIRSYGEPVECAEGPSKDDLAYEKQQRNGVQKKRHKRNNFHVQTKHQPSERTLSFFERVTDPHKAEREAMMAKDPFGRMEGRW